MGKFRKMGHSCVYAVYTCANISNNFNILCCYSPIFVFTFFFNTIKCLTVPQFYVLHSTVNIPTSLRRLNMASFKKSHIILMLISLAFHMEVNSARNINFMYLLRIEISKMLMIFVSRNYENRFKN